MHFWKVYEIVVLLGPESAFQGLYSVCQNEFTHRHVPPPGTQWGGNTYLNMQTVEDKAGNRLPNEQQGCGSLNVQVCNFRASSICKERGLTSSMRAGKKKRKNRINEITSAKPQPHLFTPGGVCISLDIFFPSNMF